MLGELLHFVGGEERLDFLAHGLLRRRRAEELPGDLVEVRKLLGAEFGKTVALEALVGEPGVERQLFLERCAGRGQGKWKCRDVTWESGQALAKSIG